MFILQECHCHQLLMLKFDWEIGIFDKWQLIVCFHLLLAKTVWKEKLKKKSLLHLTFFVKSIQGIFAEIAKTQKCEKTRNLLSHKTVEITEFTAKVFSQKFRQINVLLKNVNFTIN